MAATGTAIDSKVPNVQDVLIGLAAIAVGALFCFRGYVALRVMIPIWGAFAGFMFGAAIVAGTAGHGFLRTGLAWIVGGVVGLIFGLLAYFYYEVSIVLAMASIGFALGTSATVALGVSWSWVVIMIGIAVGLFLAVVAVVRDLPGMLLLVLSAFGGATAVIGGVMLLTRTVKTSQFTSSDVTAKISGSWMWLIAYLVLSVIGIVVQQRSMRSAQQSVRQAWSGAGF